MTSTRSDLLFAAFAAAVTYGLAGPVPAVGVAVAAMLLSFGVAGPVAALRDAAASAWDAVRGVGSIRGATLSLRWVVVMFLAGVLVGRGAQGFAYPSIDWSRFIDWKISDVIKPADPFADLSGKVASLAAAVPAETRTKAAAVYADYGGKAASYPTIAELSNAMSVPLEQAVGTEAYLALRPFRVAVAQEMSALQRAEKITDTATYGQALTAVSKGLTP